MSESDGSIEDDTITGYRRGFTAYDKGDTVNGCMCAEILDEKHQISSSLLHQRDLRALSTYDNIFSYINSLFSCAIR